MAVSPSQVKSRFCKLADRLVRRDIYLALLVTISLVAVAVFLGWYNNRVVPLNPTTSARYTLEPHNFLSFMSNWDGPSYLRLAKHGYTSPVETNFFPLYPLLIRVVNKLVGSPLVSALLIAWAALVGAVYFYLKIVRQLFKLPDNREAVKALLFFVLFPTGIFLLATYTESLFALAALGAIYFALSKRYLLAGGFTLLATATHINGLFVLLLVMLLLLEAGVKKGRILLSGIIGSLGLLGYMIFLANKFHDSLLFITSQKNHGWFKTGYTNLITGADFFNVIFVVLLVLSIFYWQKRRLSLAIYSFLFLLIPLLGKQYGGFNRYVLMAFPMQFMVYNYSRRKPLAFYFALVAMTISWTYFLLQYAGGYTGG